MYYLQYGLGFKDSIMGAIDDAIQKSANREGSINLNNVIKSFTVDETGDNLGIVLNMAEIANNTDLDTLTLNISLGKNNNGKDIIANVGLSVYMPLIDAFKLTLTSDNIHFVDYGKDVDMSALYQYINDYDFKYDEEWEASDGIWSKASEVVYTITFEENGGNAVNDITGAYGTPFALPKLSTIVSIEQIDGKNVEVTKTFAGWYTDLNNDSTLFTMTTMPKGDTTLYAKWNVSYRYEYTLTFVTNSNENVASISAFEGDNLTLTYLSIKEVVDSEGRPVIYTFSGWYTDSACTIMFNNTAMPSQNMTLYGGWEEADLSAYKLQVYDGANLIYTKYLFEGDEINLSNVSNVNSETKFYRDASFTTEINASDLIMPESDLVIYIRNKYTLNVISERGTLINQTYYVWQGEDISSLLPSQANCYDDDGTHTIRYCYDFIGYKAYNSAGGSVIILILCQTEILQSKQNGMSIQRIGIKYIFT